MPGDEEKGLGDVAPRKKRGLGTYVIIGAVALLVVLGVTLWGGGGDKTNGSPNGGSTGTPVTIPQLKSVVDSLTATVNGFGGRIANLETQVAGLVAPTVTQTDIDSLQASINSLTTSMVNWTEDLETLEDGIGNYTSVGGLSYYLFKEGGDAHLHVLSDRDGAFIAQVTVAFEHPINLSDTTANDALKNFYNQSWAEDGDYTPTISYNPADNGNWEYASVTFYSIVLNLEKGEEEEYQVDLNDLDNLDEGIDGIWIEVYPALETASSEGIFG